MDCLDWLLLEFYFELSGHFYLYFGFDTWFWSFEIYFEFIPGRYWVVKLINLSAKSQLFFQVYWTKLISNLLGLGEFDEFESVFLCYEESIARAWLFINREDSKICIWWNVQKLESWSKSINKVFILKK